MSATVSLGCLFGPKVYICIFQPYKNVRNQSGPQGTYNSTSTSGVLRFTRPTSGAAAIIAAATTTAASAHHVVAPVLVIPEASSGDMRTTSTTNDDFSNHSDDGTHVI